MERKWRRPQNRLNRYVEPYYDIIDDWDLIEASFAAQYGIRLMTVEDMDWKEFYVLLGGLMEKTPLGAIVRIRSEDDKDILKHFTPEQRRIRSEYRAKSDEKRAKFYAQQTEEEQERAMKEIEMMFARAFG